MELLKLYHMEDKFKRFICVNVTARSSFTSVVTFPPIIDCHCVTVTPNGNSVTVFVLDKT
jgi:hypothetical protein